MQPRSVRYVWHEGSCGTAPPPAITEWIERYHDAEAPATVVLASTRVDDLAKVPQRRAGEVLALVGANLDDSALAVAMRSSADDLVTLDQPRTDWQRRLTGLANLASLRSAASIRKAAAQAIRFGPAPSRDEPRRAAVLFVGAPGPHKLALVDALLGWSVAAYAETVDQARRHLDSTCFAAVVLTDPLDLSRLQRDLGPLQACTGAGTPSFVVVRGRDAGFSAADAYALGASEVVDPLLPRDLIQRRLARAIHEAELRLELRQERAFADALDPVSGCLGHSAAHTLLDLELRLPGRPDQGALLVLSLDGLDAINRECGFAAGDRVIRAAGQTLTEGVRAEDMVSRLDGSGFGIWIAATDDADIAAIAQRLQARIRLASLGDSGPALSARTGWTRPQKGDDALTLTRRARNEARRSLLTLVKSAAGPQP